MPASKSLPIYGGVDAGPRPTTRDEVRAALERGVDPVVVADHVARGLDAMTEEVLASAAPGEAKPACAKGCSFCCHQRVELTAPEVLLLARFVRAHPDEGRRARVEETARRLATMDGRAHHLARIPCALLTDGACSAYAARPLACRRAHAIDARACEAAFVDPRSDTKIPDAPRVSWHLSAMVLGFYEGAAHAGRPPHLYELHAALALADPSAEDRWLAGEDPFVTARTRAAEELPDLLGRQ